MRNYLYWMKLKLNTQEQISMPSLEAFGMHPYSFVSKSLATGNIQCTQNGDELQAVSDMFERNVVLG